MNYYKFLISISSLLNEIFVNDFFSYFITSNDYYAISTNKFNEIIHEIGLYYPINLKIIEKDLAYKIQEDLNKKDDFKNLNEFILKNDIERHKLYKTDYELHKLDYIAKIQPNLLKRENLKEIDSGISSFMLSEMNYQKFREKMNNLLAEDTAQDN